MCFFLNFHFLASTKTQNRAHFRQRTDVISVLCFRPWAKSIVLSQRIYCPNFFQIDSDVQQCNSNFLFVLLETKFIQLIFQKHLKLHLGF